MEKRSYHKGKMPASQSYRGISMSSFLVNFWLLVCWRKDTVDESMWELVGRTAFHILLHWACQNGSFGREGVLAVQQKILQQGMGPPRTGNFDWRPPTRRSLDFLHILSYFCSSIELLEHHWALHIGGILHDCTTVETDPPAFVR